MNFLPALILLSSLGFGQSTPTVNQIDSIHLSNINKSIRDLESGRPVITGLPTYQNGLTSQGTLTQTGQADLSGVVVAGSSVDLRGLTTFYGDVIGATKIYFSSGVANQTMNLTAYQEVVGSTLTVTIPSTRNIRVRMTAHMLSGSSYGHWFTGAICEDGAAVSVLCQVYLNGGLFLNCSGETYVSASAGVHNYYVCGKMNQYSCTFAPSLDSGVYYGVPYLFSIIY